MQVNWSVDRCQSNLPFKSSQVNQAASWEKSIQSKCFSSKVNQVASQVKSSQVNQVAPQRQRHLLHGPRSTGRTSSCPSCCLSASSGLCSCTFGRGEPKCILFPFLNIITRPRCQRTFATINWKWKLFHAIVFSFQLQTGNHSAPPPYEKAVVWVQRWQRCQRCQWNIAYIF